MEDHCLCVSATQELTRLTTVAIKAAKASVTFSHDTFLNVVDLARDFWKGTNITCCSHFLCKEPFPNGTCTYDQLKALNVQTLKKAQHEKTSPPLWVHLHRLILFGASFE
jgi:hypothetical protein